jgi:ubiquinone/menaquinone biosynthesis C-methylase UbiE
MQLNPTLQEKYSNETMSALEAQRLVYEISFGPIVFQVSRLMKKFGILQMLIDSKKGLTIDEISEKTKLSRYACQCLLESSLTIGTVLYKDDRFTCSKAGWFLLNDQLVDTNMDFIHNVNYLGWFHLEEALLNGKPEGLIKVFGNWSTIFEGFSQLPKVVQDSWLRFNHYYSDNTLDQALQIVFAYKPKNLLDIGGNIGHWALRCVDHDPDVQVTVMDLPQQIEQMKQNIAGKNGSDRILGYCGNLLDATVPIPAGFEAIWMSQLLDNFSETESVDILSRIAKSMSPTTKLYVMEIFWDRQPFDTGAYTLTQVSLYFAALSTGRGKNYSSEDTIRFIEAAGLAVEEIKDGIGKGHTIIQCKKL